MERTGPGKKSLAVLSVAASSGAGLFFFRRQSVGPEKKLRKSVESASAEAPDVRGGACAGQREAKPELRALFLPAVSQIHS